MSALTKERAKGRTDERPDEVPSIANYWRSGHDAAAYLLPKEEFYLATRTAAAVPAANHINDTRVDRIKISFDLYVTSKQNGKCT